MEGCAGAELGCRAPIGQPAHRDADTVRVTCQGQGQLPVGGRRGAGTGARAPCLAGAGGGGGSCQLEQQDGRGGSSAPQRDGPGSRSRHRRPRCRSVLSATGPSPPRRDRLSPCRRAPAGPPEPEPEAEGAERPRAQPVRSPRCCRHRCLGPGQRRSRVPPGSKRRARRGVAGAGPGPAGTRRRPPARAAAAAAAAAACAGNRARCAGAERAPAGRAPPRLPGGCLRLGRRQARAAGAPRSRRRGRSPGERAAAAAPRGSRALCSAEPSRSAVAPSDPRATPAPAGGPGGEATGMERRGPREEEEGGGCADCQVCIAAR